MNGAILNSIPAVLRQTGAACADAATARPVTSISISARISASQKNPSGQGFGGWG
jgi:hypothetical protein